MNTSKAQNAVEERRTAGIPSEVLIESDAAGPLADESALKVESGSLPAVVVDDLFSGADQFINAALGISRYDTRTGALELSRRKPLDFDGVAFVRTLFELLVANWDRALSLSPAGSIENFRWHAPRVDLSDRNTSPEVTLERYLLQACGTLGRTDWSNQVPLISGLSGSYLGKRRAVDLVRQLPEGGFEFVELKTGSDAPLFAALEILQYGLLWLVSRRDMHRLGYAGRPIIEAERLHLSVLAPRAFYAGLDLDEFATELDRGIAALGREHDVEMAFRQTTFPKNFDWCLPCPYSPEEMVALLDSREPV